MAVTFRSCHPLHEGTLYGARKLWISTVQERGNLWARLLISLLRQCCTGALLPFPALPHRGCLWCTALPPCGLLALSEISLLQPALCQLLLYLWMLFANTNSAVLRALQSCLTSFSTRNGLLPAKPFWWGSVRAALGPCRPVSWEMVSSRHPRCWLWSLSRGKYSTGLPGWAAGY